MIYKSYVKTNQSEFIAKVKDVSLRLKIRPQWLMVVFAAETAYTFSPTVRAGGKVNGAVGLIQFTEVSCQRIGVSKAQLANMSNVEQLDWVEKYFVSWGAVGKMKDLGDVYMVVFAPAMFGRPETTKVYQSPNQSYAQNSGMDKDKKGFITVLDIKNFVYKNTPKNQKNNLTLWNTYSETLEKKKLLVQSKPWPVVLIAVIFVTAFLLIYSKKEKIA